MYKHLTIVSLIGLFFASQAIANTTHPADFDGDGIAGFSDFLAFVEKFGSRQGDETYQVKYDLDGNGVIEFSDFFGICRFVWQRRAVTGIKRVGV